MHQTKELVTHFSDLVVGTSGEHTSFEKICSFQASQSNSLIFLQDIDHYDAQTPPAVIVTIQSVADKLQNLFNGFVVNVKDAKLAQALIKQYYDDYQSLDAEWADIHSSAIIHETVQLGDQCIVGPNVVIGANSVIGERVIIRANAVIEHDVKIGPDSIINSLVNIGYSCELGKEVIIQSGCIIGNEGYGFASDENGSHHRIPHTGNVVLHDYVHIGSNSCIDRATYGSTIINKGVKLDNHCHIAHNVEIGENTLLTAHCVIAGSSKIGKRVMMSGQTGVLDHKTIADDTVLVHRAGVIEDIPHGGMWAGLPAKPFKEFVRGLSADKKIRKIESDIKELKKLQSKK
ncbi:MAG: UDP-3-O-(3-hydroxymyristoyl)glucosamine N-acyltransferase [Acidiferrobacterales bacterium]|nr:UDP-3-O-(3-hydroxymyristoyl)glucosamine N-acyltransferase [Acidiferrobacterales bacterium]